MQCVKSISYMYMLNTTILTIQHTAPVESSNALCRGMCDCFFRLPSKLLTVLALALAAAGEETSLVRM